jgi:DNA polymerase III epsilon subunit-like protein
MGDEKKNKTVYCSLDIETTGFDPLKDEILEVGFIFFTLDKKGLKLGEEYTQVFKPSVEVPAKILGLTGITQAELENAPKFTEHKEIIQSKLKDAVIVGHNIIFDIRFLEASGIKFSGKTIDTLDLVQWLLPTHHSYNLENLMHFFGISHKDAHRALADAKASVKVLEKLFGIYSNFSKETKQKIQKIIEPKEVTWKEFLELEWTKVKLVPKKERTKKLESQNIFEDFGSIEKNKIYNLPFGFAGLAELFPYLNKQKKKLLFVLPKKQDVVSLCNNLGLVSVFNEDENFNAERFNEFLNRAELTLEEIKFILKILVWQEEMPESINLFDLNLSFFGGQFKNLINGKEVVEPKDKIVVTDQKTFLDLAKENKFNKRLVIIENLAEFESKATFGIGQRVSWGSFIYNLKSFYNLENSLEDSEYKTPVEELTMATDMFFGLTMALLKKQDSGFNYVKVTEEFTYSEEYRKVQKVSESFIEKIETYNKILKSEKLDSLKLGLVSFFQSETNTVKWFEISEKTCVFQSAPIDIKPLLNNLWPKFAGVSFIDCLCSPKFYEYFNTRLGLENFEVKPVKLSEGKGVQADLFSQTKKISCYIQSQDSKTLLTDVAENNLPAVVLFGSQLAVKEFYEAHYAELKEYAFLLAQSASGGSNKMLNNFDINQNSLLLATDKFILKYITGNTSSATKENLEVKTLVLGHLPFEQFSHPYQEAVSAQFENVFMDFALPRALLNFHKLLVFFYSKKLANVYLTDAKMQKEYGKFFKEYLQSIGCFEIKI